MGIRGLTTYIENRSDIYLKPYELHDTNLIIDGCNISSQLYCTISACNHEFGGDYDQFAYCVSKFFKDLLQCKVKPLVILDGGWERKKKATLIIRAKKRMEIVSEYNRGNQKQAFFPLLLQDVFVDVMQKMDIKHVMSTFEADDSISSISKLLDVPVLSYDSDFFIYGVNYIPFNTLDSYIVKRGNDYFKRCRIYRPDILLERFKGLDTSVLPLASILMGNDYIRRKTFMQFLSLLKIKKTKNQNEQQRRIEIIFHWLKNYSLDSAIAAILRRLPPENREDILKSIEIIVNGYLSLSTYMLRPLGFDENNVIHRNSKPYKFSGDLGNLDEIHDFKNNVELKNDIGESINYCISGEDSEEDEINENAIYKESDENKFFATLPQWYMDNHLAGRFPKYFINIIKDRVYMVPVQIEDCNKSSVEIISFPILKTICSLLTTSKNSKANEVNKDIQLLIRKGFTLGYQFLSVPLSPINFEDVRSISVIERRKIINDALQIQLNDKLNEFPSSWQLYIAAILFWMRQSSDTPRTKLHLSALLMCALNGMLNQINGLDPFNKASAFIKKNTRISKNEEHNEIVKNDDSIILTTLIRSVTKEDCTAVLSFFSDHMKLNKKERSIPKKFSIELVHVYTQFQCCLKYAMHLNALLDYIYVQPSPSKLLNGTLFYNFYKKFSTRHDVYSYIVTKMKNSLSLLRVFETLNQKILDALKDIKIDEEFSCSRKRRQRCRKRKQKLFRMDSTEIVEQNNNESDIDEDGDFYDPSNLFTLLSVS